MRNLNQALKAMSITQEELSDSVPPAQTVAVPVTADGVPMVDDTPEADLGEMDSIRTEIASDMTDLNNTIQSQTTVEQYCVGLRQLKKTEQGLTHRSHRAIGIGHADIGRRLKLGTEGYKPEQYPRANYATQEQRMAKLTMALEENEQVADSLFSRMLTSITNIREKMSNWYKANITTVGRLEARIGALQQVMDSSEFSKAGQPVAGKFTKRIAKDGKILSAAEIVAELKRYNQAMSVLSNPSNYGAISAAADSYLADLDKMIGGADVKFSTKPVLSAFAPFYKVASESVEGGLRKFSMMGGEHPVLAEVTNSGDMDASQLADMLGKTLTGNGSVVDKSAVTGDAIGASKQEVEQIVAQLKTLFASAKNADHAVEAMKQVTEKLNQKTTELKAKLKAKELDKEQHAKLRAVVKVIGSMVSEVTIFTYMCEANIYSVLFGVVDYIVASSK